MKSQLVILGKVMAFLGVFTAAFVAQQLWSAHRETQREKTETARRLPDDLLERMEKNVVTLAAIVEQPIDQNDSIDRTDELITEIDNSLRRLPGQTGDTYESARLVQLQGYFLAAMRKPKTYHELFLRLSDKLERDYPNSMTSFQASILRFASKHDLTQPLDQKGLEELMDQASGYTQPQQATALCSIVSHQLYVNDQDESAKVVLETGLDRFQGHPGWHDLFHQLFAQKHIEEPLPRVADADTTWRPQRPRKKQSTWDWTLVYRQGDEIRSMTMKMDANMSEAQRRNFCEMKKRLTKRGGVIFERRKGEKKPLYIGGRQVIR